MFGSRKTLGAAIIPLTAPSTAANPQPSASIQPTRTPISRLAFGLIAVARRASPRVVKRKNAQSRPTTSRHTASVPMSCVEIATSPTSNVRLGNGLSNDFTSAPQIQGASPFSAIRMPIVTITIASGDACSTGLIRTRSTATPPVKAITSVSAKAGQYGMPRFISSQAMYVVNMAISPWAKFTTCVER
jgi:hypothetical protein